MKDLKYFTLISLVCSFLIPFHTSGQISQELRYELEIKEGEKGYQVVPHHNGLLLFKQLSNSKGKQPLWEMLSLNDSLREDWKSKFFLSSFIQYDRYRIYNGHVMLLFKSLNSFGYKVIDVEPNSGTVRTFDIPSYIPVQVEMFEISDRAIVLGGSYKDRPIAMVYYPHLGRTLLLPTIYNREGKLTDIFLDRETIDVAVSIKEGRQRLLHLYSFTYEGKMTQNTILFPEGKKSLQEGKFVRWNDQHYVVGTYGHKSSEYSRGLFFAEMNGNRDIVYHNYGEFSNFFDYMRDRKMRRIKRKIVRRKEAGKPLRFNYRLKIDKLMTKDDEIVLIGEAFYPQYRNYSSFGNRFAGTRGYSYNPYLPSVVFDGYRYTHAVIVGFNKRGKIIWDHSFELDKVENHTLERIVHYSSDDDKLLLYYASDNKLKTKLIDEDEVIQTQKEVPLTLKYNEDELRLNLDDNTHGVVDGSDNSFYAYGIQKIRNSKNKNVKLNREVFFVNKMIYK